MSNVSVAVLFADVPGFPAGTSVSALQVSVNGGAAISFAADASLLALGSFDAGDYTFSLQAVDASGAALGSAVTGSFSVTAPTTVTLSLPASASATVS